MWQRYVALRRVRYQAEEEVTHEAALVRRRPKIWDIWVNTEKRGCYDLNDISASSLLSIANSILTC